MSTRAGFPTLVVPFVIPGAFTPSGTPFTNGGLPITTLDEGRWLITVSTAIKAKNVGENVNTLLYQLTKDALFGNPAARLLVGLERVGSSAVNAQSIASQSNICVITANDTPIFLRLVATVSAGNYATPDPFVDGSQFVEYNTITFVRLSS
jgi:hypothetical protein